MYKVAMFNPNLVPLNEHIPPEYLEPIKCETLREAEKIASNSKFQTVFVTGECSSDKLILYKNGKKII